MADEPTAARERRLLLLEDILDHIDVDIAVLDPELRFEYINPASIPDPELRSWLVGRTNRDYCLRRGKPMALAEAREEAARVALEEGVRCEETEEIVDAEGRTHHLLRVHLPVRDEDGRIRRIIGYGFDRTEAVATAHALRRSQEREAERRRLEATGRLAGGLAHEFNNLLTAIRVQAELLAEEIDGGDVPGREGFDEILAAADRAADLVAHLLSFSRGGGLEGRRVEVTAAVRDAFQALTDEVGSSVTLRVVRAPGSAHVLVDPDQLREALLCLGRNAADAMPDGGTLTVSWTLEEDPASVWIRVEDTGTGMRPEVRARALEPFFTTRRGQGRTGLGLSVVHGVVTGAGGTLVVESEEGRGTVVEMRLPRFAAADGGAGGDDVHGTVTRVQAAAEDAAADGGDHADGGAAGDDGGR